MFCSRVFDNFISLLRCFLNIWRKILTLILKGISQKQMSSRYHDKVWCVFVPNANTIHDRSLRGDFLHHQGPLDTGWIPPVLRFTVVVAMRPCDVRLGIQFFHWIFPRKPFWCGFARITFCGTQAFLRSSVIASDLLIFLPGPLGPPFFCWKCFRQTEKGALIDAEKTIAE